MAVLLSDLVVMEQGLFTRSFWCYYTCVCGEIEDRHDDKANVNNAFLEQLRDMKRRSNNDCSTTAKRRKPR